MKKSLIVVCGLCGLAVIAILLSRDRKPVARTETPPAAVKHPITNTPPVSAVKSNATVKSVALSKPELIKQVVGASFPPSNVATNLTQADEQQLLAIYNKTPLRDRWALVWSLARVGGDETAKAFINTLRNEFSGKRLVADEGNSLGNEEAVMEAIATALGMVASRSQVAYDFVMQGLDPSFWQDVAKWQSTTGKEINGELTSSAMQGLGMMQRDGIDELLLKLKDNLPIDNTVPERLRRTFEGELMQAAYYIDLRKQLGEDGFYAWFLAWISTEENQPNTRSQSGPNLWPRQPRMFSGRCRW